MKDPDFDIALAEKGEWEKTRHGLAKGNLGWNMITNLRWLAHQHSRPDYVPMGIPTGTFLLSAAEGYQSLSDKFIDLTSRRYFATWSRVSDIPGEGCDLPGPIDWENASHWVEYNYEFSVVETWCRVGPDKKFPIKTRIRKMVESEIIHGKLRDHSTEAILKAFGITETPSVLPKKTFSQKFMSNLRKGIFYGRRLLR